MAKTRLVFIRNRINLHHCSPSQSNFFFDIRCSLGVSMRPCIPLTLRYPKGRMAISVFSTVFIHRWSGGGKQSILVQLCLFTDDPAGEAVHPCSTAFVHRWHGGGKQSIIAQLRLFTDYPEGDINPSLFTCVGSHMSRRGSIPSVLNCFESQNVPMKSIPDA